jgi:hypothetical protein
MTSILNIFSDKETKEMSKNKKISPSLKQGKKFKKYQNKIENSLEKNAKIVSGKEGFSDMEGISLTNDTQNIISNNNYTSQQQIIDNLRQEYQNTIQQYEDLVNKISGNLTDYVDRVNPNNPYLNKTIRFTTGHICYVTNQGVVKYIPSMEIWQSVNIPQNYIDINIPFLDSYTTPGTQIATNPPLVSGTFMQLGQSVGNEGSNVFVNEFLPQNTNPTYMGCYATNNDNNNMTFIGGSPPPQSNASIQNGSFSQPVLSNNTFQYITSSSQVPGWYFGGPALLNNSSAWGYPTPYPNGNQCVSLQNTTYINCVLNLVAGATYTISFYSCGRNCCTTPNTANMINVQLYTTSNQLVQNIYQYTPPVNTWTQYTATFSVQVTGTYKLFFSGTNTSGDRSSAIQNIVLNSTGASSNGTYSYDACQEAAITSGNRYFALQNINTSTGLGYCAVSNSQPAVTQYGESQVPSKAVALWSSNTSGQSGNICTLTNTGSLQVLNSSGQVIYSSPIKQPEQGSYLGCYADTSNRAMPNTSNNAYYSLDKCKELAQQQGYIYYAGQNAYQDASGNWNVWCAGSNDLTTAQEYGVATNCIDANGTMLGGGWSNAIYTLSGEGNYFLILQDDGNMVIYRGTGPSDNQGTIWATGTNGQQQSANPNVVATKSKYGQNWMASGSSLAPGDFIGSTNGNLALVMQTDGNLVLYTYQMETNCQKMSDGNMGGGVGGNAAYDIGKTAVSGNMGALGYVDSDANLYTYPSTNSQFTNTYPTTITGMDTLGNDIPGAAFGNATLESCQTACNNNPQCAGFVTNAAGNYCWPKTSSMYPFGGASSPNTDRNIYVRGRQPSSPPLGVSQNTNSTDSVTYQNYINKGQVGSQYGLANATTAQKQELEQLQTRMSLLSNQITDLTNKFQGGSITAENQSVANITGIEDYVKNIATTNKKIGVVAGETNGNIHNILTDSDIVVLQKNYDYLFWSILAAGTVLISMNIVKKQ